MFNRIALLILMSMGWMLPAQAQTYVTDATMDETVMLENDRVVVLFFYCYLVWTMSIHETHNKQY